MRSNPKTATPGAFLFGSGLQGDDIPRPEPRPLRTRFWPGNGFRRTRRQTVTPVSAGLAEGI